MIRKDFLKTLELVAPALAQENLVAIFQSFCFNDNTVYAWRDTLGVVAPCPVDKNFAVHGKTFIDLIRASNAKEIDIELDKENVLVRAGKSKMKLPFSEASDFIFEEPEDEKWDVMMDIDKHLLRGFQLCLTTSSTDNAMPAFMGISVVTNGTDVLLYSCDGDAISRFTTDGKTKAKVHYTIPNDFCETLLKIADKTGYRNGQLYVNGQWAVAELSNGFRIFGRIIENPEPMQYEKDIARVLKVSPEFVEIPSTLNQALNRARIIGETENRSTDLRFDGKKLYMTTDSHMGIVKDILPLKSKHPSLEVKVNAKLMSRAISVTSEFAVQEDCTAYRHGDDFFLVMANLAE